MESRKITPNQLLSLLFMILAIFFLFASSLFAKTEWLKANVVAFAGMLLIGVSIHMFLNTKATKA